MAEIQLPHLNYPDSMSQEEAWWVRENLRYMAQQLQTALDSMSRDRRFSDERVASGLRTMQGAVILDKASKPNPNDIFYSPDGIHGMWGALGTPSPTDPGTGPVGGVSDGDKQDITVSGSGATWIIDNDVVTFAKMQNIATRRVLGRNTAASGDVEELTMPTTRYLWIPAARMTNGSTIPATFQVIGTDPDQYVVWTMDDLGDYTILDTGIVLTDWLSGTVEVSVFWTTDGAVAANWVPYVEVLERVDGDSMVANATTITGAAESTNHAADILKITAVGTFTPGAAGRLYRLAVRRLALADANDNSTANINIVGLRLSYTSVY